MSKKGPSGNKISGQFASRLSSARPGQPVRAMVMLDVSRVQGARGSGKGAAGRAGTVADLRLKLAAGVDEVDRILARHSGRRLSEGVNALGTLEVETSAAGLYALAQSEYVKAILENQAVSLIAK